MSGIFKVESKRVLRIDVDGGVWIKPGAAIAYRGDLSFERRRTTDARSVDQVAVRELSPLVRASGRGCLYCADRGSRVQVHELRGETLVVVGKDLLAFESSVICELSLLGNGVGVAAGGLIVATLSGEGACALTSHGETLQLDVTPDAPVNTDPHATVAWSGGLTPTLKTDLTWRSLIGHGGGQPVQMRFEGNGFVLVQPYKDASRFGVVEDPVGAVARVFMG